MSGYRFCRTDDVPLLVRAYNECYAVHFPDAPPLSVEEFKRRTRELQLWASSCMIATAGDEPVGVLLSYKREAASLIHCVGVRPDHQGNGHGRHLLHSLSRKLAILGPPRLLAEVPAGLPRAGRFLESCGYHESARYTDFARDAAPAPGDAADAVVEVSVDDVLDSGAMDPDVPRAWERCPPTLRARRSEIGGLALATDRMEAFVLHRQAPDAAAREMVGIGHAGGRDSEALLSVLLEHFCAVAGNIRAPRLSEGEVSSSLLESRGFRKTGETVGYEATATPG